MGRLAALALAVLPLAAHAQAGAPSASGFGWFATLAGSCWRADPGPRKTTDRQCYEEQYGRFIRGTIRIYEGDALVTEGESIFVPDSKSKRIYYTQWASNGSYGSGEMVVEGSILRFQNRGPGGAEAPMRFSWTQIDPDSFRVVREKKLGPIWKEDQSVVYRRVK